ncbi:type IX secretion system protein PorQ [Aquiflexum lacus]|uniref:type IX secretion system protein PorQ n=1 Tax=Aquiflexum lacus TaxID=2483805 RepID=UPI00293C050D|nr:type IX secretion system protein PorQ [Aquiflexum lacus]
MGNCLKYILVFYLGCFMMVHQKSNAQTSRSAYNFIDNPSFTKLAGLGGVNITSGNDVLMFMSNPALLDSTSINTPAFHYLNFPGGIHVATLGYNVQASNGGVFGIALQYFDYGNFEGFDAIGIGTGHFGANEFSLVVGYARQLGVFRYGANAKILGSVLEGYQAYALAFDFGVNYHHPEKDLVFGLNVRNIGFNMSTYIEGQKLQLPSDVRFGGSFKPEYAPFRFHMTLRNLNGREEDFFFPDPSVNREAVSSVDKMFRRAVFGVEVLPSENLAVRLGYNHLIRKEFGTSAGAGAGGFTGGFAFKVKKFELSYSRMFYNIPGGSNVFGVTTAINEWRTF